MSPAERVDGASAVVDLSIADARDLGWRLVKIVEKEDFAAALKDRPSDGKPGELLSEYGLRDLLEWFGVAGSEATGQADLDAAVAALRPHARDAELRASAARFEKGAGLAAGEVLGVPPGEEAGSIYPLINMRQYWPQFGHWESCHCDSAYPADGDCVVMRPCGENAALPAPVMVWLAGNAAVDGRVGIWGGCFAALLQNEEIRNNFYILHPMPMTRSGLITYTGEGFKWTWNEDALWSMITQVLQRLGPEKVDPSRVYVSGLSLGAQGTWRLATKYGKHLAAVVPMAGQCDWAGDSWPKGSDPSESVLANLKAVAMRAYHTDTDDYAGNPKKDIEWLGYGAYESGFDLQVAGLGHGEVKSSDADMFRCLVEGGIFPMAKEKGEGEGAPDKIRRPEPRELKRLDVEVKQWTRKWPERPLEFWSVKGPLFDVVAGSYHTSHILHYRIFLNPLWGFASFLLEHKTSEEDCWKFGSEPFVADGSEHRRYVEERWGEPLFQAEDDRPPLQEPTPLSHQFWEVQGGEKEGGIIVRQGVALDSPQESARLSTGAVVAGLELQGSRLLYELRFGEGPLHGWVSITSSKGKQLLTRCEKPAPLNGIWHVRMNEGRDLVGTAFCRHLPGLQQCDGTVMGWIGPGDIRGSISDGAVELKLGEHVRVRGRLLEGGKATEDTKIVFHDEPEQDASLTWVHPLTHIRETGRFKIVLAAQHPGQEFMQHWYLGAYRHHALDSRDDNSAFVCAHTGTMGKWAEMEWAFIPGSRPNTFRIEFKYAEGMNNFFIGPRFYEGWCLCVQNNRMVGGKESKDFRDRDSSYVSLSNPKAWADAKKAEWELVPGRLAGCFKLRLAEMVDSRDWIGNTQESFWLCAMRFVLKDQRTERSHYACVQSDSWQEIDQYEWEFAPGSEPNTRIIKLVKATKGNSDYMGWYLSAVRQLATDKRTDDSSFVFLQAPVKNQKLAEWELIPTATEEVFKIRLHSLPINSPGPGWYLGAQHVSSLGDHRNADALFASVQDATVWPEAAEAEWRLHPTGEENRFRAELKSMPHRNNRTGCWLNAVKGIDKDARTDQSTFASVISAGSFPGAAVCEWFLAQ